MTELEKYRYINVWDDKSNELLEEIISFWLTNKALTSRETAKKRVPQVVYIVKDHSDKLVGVCTAYEKFNEKLENRFFYYRTFVTATGRLFEIGLTMLLKTRNFFESRFKDRRTTPCIGMFMEIENKNLQVHKNEAVWPRTGFVYVGKNEKGDHERVYYFKEARIS